MVSSATRRRNRVVAALLGLGVVLLLGWLLLFSSLFAVREVAVRGTARLSPEQVRQAAAVPLGRPLLRVDAAAVRRRVAALPAVSSVDVHRSWPRTLQLQVTERRPVAALPDGDRVGLLDAGGVRFAEQPVPPPGLPVLGEGVTDPRSPSGRAALAVLAGLPAPLAGSVATVTAGAPEAVRLQLRGGATVAWGDPGDVTRKAILLQALLRRPAAVYDVSTPGVVTTR